jgi:hypothetical protein
MKKILSIILLINFYTFAYSQTIKGIVLDRNNNNPIHYATVYFNGTYTGTLTDENGNFELDILDNGLMPITISTLGYYSVTTSNYSIDESLLILLISKVFDLVEVEVIGDGNYLKKREKNLKIFKREFLGTSKNAKMCVITNESDIFFDYDTKKSKFSAFSSKPILIENRALGYKITYYLDKFEFNTANRSVLIMGNYLFKDAFATNEIENQQFEKRREITYLGSRMHFFRALWENKVELSDYIIADSKNPRLNYVELVAESHDRTLKRILTKKHLKYNGNLFVTYYPKKWLRRNTLSIAEEVYFDERGYYDPLSVVWEGAMAIQRVADLLPYEYSIK